MYLTPPAIDGEIFFQDGLHGPELRDGNGLCDGLKGGKNWVRILEFPPPFESSAEGLAFLQVNRD